MNDYHYTSIMSDRRKNKTDPQHSAEGALIDTLRVSRALDFDILHYFAASKLYMSESLPVNQNDKKGLPRQPEAAAEGRVWGVSPNIYQWRKLLIYRREYFFKKSAELLYFTRVFEI